MEVPPNLNSRTFPSLIIVFLIEAVGPNPHFLGYVSLSMMTRLIFAITPWSQEAIVAVVICANAIHIASPLVVVTTISSFNSIPSSYRRTPIR